MSVERLSEHRRIWAGKPVLQQIYGVWFRDLLATVREGAVLEVGAGPGLLTEWARAERPDLSWVATDLLGAPWNDVVADATRLPLRTGTVDHVVALDVLHHLADPYAFFAEAARVTRPGGSVVAIEPWVTPGPTRSIVSPTRRAAHSASIGAPLRSGCEDGRVRRRRGAALAHRAVDDLPPNGRPSTSRPRTRTCNGFAYVLSLGFKRASLLPETRRGRRSRIDRALSPLSRWTGMRALIVWERRG